jgi:hypothetical protein
MMNFQNCISLIVDRWLFWALVPVHDQSAPLRAADVCQTFNNKMQLICSLDSSEASTVITVSQRTFYQQIRNLLSADNMSIDKIRIQEHETAMVPEHFRKCFGNIKFERI